ncbi:MAG: cell division protein FtsL [Nitrospirota bacterium]
MKVVATLAGVALLLLVVWERVDVVRVGYQIEQLKVRKAMLHRERDELRVKVSALTAPDRIAKAASEKLGMGPPQQGQVVLVRVAREQPVLAASPAPPEIKLAKNEPLPGRIP